MVEVFPRMVYFAPLQGPTWPPPPPNTFLRDDYTMKITLYKSSLCPRCHFARKSLEQLAAARLDVELEVVDILSSPRRALQDGVRMIPAIKSGERLLSGIYLNRTSIAAFLDAARRS